MDIKGKIPVVVEWAKSNRKILLIIGAALLIMIIFWRCDVASYKDKLAGMMPAGSAIKEELKKVKEENEAFRERYGALDKEQSVLNEEKIKIDKNLANMRAKKQNIRKELSNADKNKSLASLSSDFKRLGYHPILITR